MGRIATISSSPVDENGIPLTSGGNPAVSISFTVPTNDVSLNGGANGPVSFVLRNESNKNVLSPLSYPTSSSTSTLNWIVPQELGYTKQYKVAVQVLDQQFVSKTDGELPSVPRINTVEGSSSNSTSVQSITYVSAPSNLKITRLANGTSANLSWTPQTPAPGQGYLFDPSFVNVLVVLDDVSGSPVVPATDVSFTDVSRNITSLTVGRKYSAHLIPKQRFGSFTLMRNVEAVSFIAAGNPTSPTIVSVLPADKQITFDWSDSTAVGGRLGNYEVAAIQDVSSSSTTPAFPTNQKAAESVSASLITINKAYTTLENGLSTSSASTQSMVNNTLEGYRLAVRSTSSLDASSQAVPVTYESLRLNGPASPADTLRSEWTVLLDKVFPSVGATQPGSLTVVSDISNVSVSWPADIEEFVVYLNNALYFTSSTYKNTLLQQSGASRLINGTATDASYSYVPAAVPGAGASHLIRCGLRINEIRVHNISKGGVLSPAQTLQNVSALQPAGSVTSAAFEVIDASTCRVTFTAPVNTGGAGQTVSPLNGSPSTAGNLMYLIHVENAQAQSLRNPFETSSVENRLTLANNSSVFIAIQTYWMINNTRITNNDKVYVNRMSGSTRQPIVLGPAPVAGTIGDVQDLATGNSNQISFKYRTPAPIGYPISSLQVRVFDGNSEITSQTITPQSGSSSFAYDVSSQNIDVSGLKLGKSYKVQVEPIGNYFSAQNPPLSIATVVPYKKMEILSIAKNGDNYTCDVSLNGDKITGITAIIKPSAAGPLTIQTPLVTSNPNLITFSGFESATHGPLQTARFSFSSPGSASALVIVNGKTFDILDNPANSFGAVIPPM